MMSVLLDISLFCCLLIFLYWIWLSFKYLFAVGRWIGYWVGYRFIPAIKVKYNGVFVGRITQKKYDEIILKIKEGEEG